MKVKVNGAWVEVPTFVTSQGSGDWELIADVTTSEKVESIEYNNLPNYSELFIYQPSSQGFFEDGSGNSKQAIINVEVNSKKNGYGYQVKTSYTQLTNYPRRVYIKINVIDTHVIGVSNTNASSGGATTEYSMNFDLGEALKFDKVKIFCATSGYYISQGIHLKIYGKK